MPAYPPRRVPSGCELGFFAGKCSRGTDACISDHAGSVRTVGFDLGVTAAQIREFAEDVNAQIESVNVDVGAAAANPNADWDLKVGTAWLDFYHAWQTELADARELDANVLPRFGYGAAYDRIRDYQVQAAAWQKKIAAISKASPSGPTIEPQKGGSGFSFGDAAPYALGAGLALGLVLLLRK